MAWVSRENNGQDQCKRDWYRQEHRAGEEEVQEYEVTVEGDGDLAEVRGNPTFEGLNAFQGRGFPRQPQSHGSSSFTSG